MRFSSRYSVLFCALLNALVAAAASSCYYPNGLLAPSHQPCHPPDQGVTFCCPPGWTCLANRLCQKSTDTVYQNFTRASCTDPTWQSEICPQFCLQVPFGNNPVHWCGKAYPITYCCTDKCNCQTHQDGIQLYAPTTVISIIASATTLSSTAQTGMSSSTVSSSSGETTQLSTSSTSPIPFSSTEASSAISSSAAESSNSPSAAASTGGSSTNTTAIAVGIVVPVVVIGLLIGAYLFYRSKWNFGPAAEAPMPLVAEKDGGSQNISSAYAQQNEKIGLQDLKPQERHEIGTPTRQDVEHNAPAIRHEMSG